TSTLPSIKLRKCSSKIITSILSFISGRLATKSNQIKQLIRNGRSASLQRTFKKSFTSFSHSTRNKTRDGLIRVRNIRALNGRFNTSITHAYSIVIGSKHITLNATGGGFLTASKQFRHGATSKSTEKLMDELAQCYNVLPQLDINNTIDYRPEGDEKWFLENEKTVTQFCRKLAAERPLKDIRDEYNYPKKKGIKDECSRLLEASTMKSRRGFAIQRLMNAMRQAHADGWFIVFDTLTLADDRLEAFYDNPNALRDYFRDIGPMVLAAEGRKANDSHADCYQYFCVPEYGAANGRLHFHAVHFM